MFMIMIILTPLVWCQNVPIVFTGQSLSPYNGEDVQFAQTLYVVDRAIYSTASYLYLSYERLRLPEDAAVEGTPEYDSIVARNATASITARCTDIDVLGVRLGATITNLNATVTGQHNIRIDGLRDFDNNERPTQRPDMGNARLVVCGANLEYYCPEWEGTYGAGSDEEFALEHLKTVKALANIDADVFALTELQQGASSLDSLVNSMNRATNPGRYAHVEDYDSVNNTYIKVGFIYQPDKVRPILHLGHPYAPSNNLNVTRYGDHRRLEVQCFEEIATGERFVISMNHFKSKSGGDSTNNYYNSNRVAEANNLIQFLETELNNDYYEDADILILGDLNCGTMEEPIRTLTAAGYENLLAQYSPNEYSYSYSRQVEYLDHALASPSLAAQVTNARPYHLNADESYMLHYDHGDDTTMYRYSDHDPIIVGLNLSSTPNDSCRGLHYFESFAQSFGCFDAVNVTGNNVWYGYANYECVAISGNGVNTDWLVGPTFDLRHKTDAAFRFTHTIGYGDENAWRGCCKLLISKDFSGDLAAATWAQLTIPNMPSSWWNWQENEIAIPASYLGQPAVTLAFLYEVQNGDNPTWEIKNVGFTATCDTVQSGVQEIPTVPETFRAWGSDGRIVVESENPADITVFDLTGRQVFYQQKIENSNININNSGIYFVRCGNVTKKVFVY